VPEASYAIQKPVFVGAAAQDYICIADMQITTDERLCPQRTVKIYGGDHWLMWSHAEQVNQDLLAWLEELPTDA
jgi:soluble epoxide hydrolase/lipid-phosphate phosphatase